jgi:hypothetical protein
MSLFDLDDQMDDAGRMAATFSTELGRVRDSLSETTRDFGNLESGLSGGLRRAINGLVVDGDRLSDALSTVGRAMIDTVYKAAMKPVTDRLGGLMGQGLNGLVSNVMPFAKGGVVSGATAFPMRGGIGLMGEAGPEAIMPLTRGADGSLGVRAQGGGSPSVTINISTPDVAGFRRSQAQIAAEMSRLMARGARNR